ncbi:hypothetical protein LX15_001241 [Streptoalloteichus tenebrarius]|uniref:Uncharacterized protein n=1 Tax=Streptoalloteichus tenebrarius (strain ATCC 17920 / DSM 40477 / JCM 4838 / CBS 697.72 / NBRC 16177 / NCIMB 11028 / NRRL B-12390 / A12253. 1 / ISP 5477) TaxID=1933 RepID=A0ABT1HPW5_STRSD|nr:rhomboid-like protein [Streptoalloteichus tenebrarius]MCP2257556.1 hypothetical protein [Streptoalloteichus tenebrarius]
MSSAAVVGRFVRRAPGTTLWFLALTATTVVLASLPEWVQERLLVRRSTNLYQLAHHPFRVLVASAFWISPSAVLVWLGLAQFLVMFLVFLHPLERWLGTLRWLAVVVTGHAGGTLVAQGLLALRIHLGQESRALVFGVDVGASYGVAAAAGVLVWRLARPWSARYGLVMFTLLALTLVVNRTYDDVGHLSAFLLGVACRPLTHDRPTWDPGQAWRRRRAAAPPPRG